MSIRKEIVIIRSALLLALLILMFAPISKLAAIPICCLLTIIAEGFENKMKIHEITTRKQ